MLTDLLGPMAGPALGVLAYMVAKLLDHFASRARNNTTYFQAEREALDRGTKELIRGLENRVEGQAADLARAKEREDEYIRSNRRLNEDNIRLKQEMADLRDQNTRMESDLQALREHVDTIEERLAMRREERLDP